MNRGVDHQPVFFADIDRVDFGDQLARVHDELDVDTLAYCLMGNHYHLLLRVPPEVLPTAMQSLISVYTRHTNDRIGRDGPLFRGRYHSIPVETDAYLMQVSRYIHRNPLALPGVESPRDHRWSSYRTYLGLRTAPDFLDLAPVTALLGGRAGVAEFTEKDRGGELIIRAPITIEDVRLLVDCAIAVDDLTHPSEDAARQRLGRTVMILLADRSRDQPLREVLATELAHATPSAAALATRRARRRHRGEPMVRRVLAWVEAQLPLAPAPRSEWV